MAKRAQIIATPSLRSQAATEACHRVAGRGIDLRPTDLDVQPSCTDCHAGDAAHWEDDPESHPMANPAGLDAAAADVRDRLDRVARSLPEEADRPYLRKFDLASFPILILGAASDLDPIQMRRIIDDQVAVCRQRSDRAEQQVRRLAQRL